MPTSQGSVPLTPTWFDDGRTPHVEDFSDLEEAKFVHYPGNKSGSLVNLVVEGGNTTPPLGGQRRQGKMGGGGKAKRKKRHQKAYIVSQNSFKRQNSLSKGVVQEPTEDLAANTLYTCCLGDHPTVYICHHAWRAELLQGP